ncbi:hypothetical protein [Streptomyces sp. NPDC048659]|uniref:hypothetical protein n=1 Tax=Streptomyces sp. NPDC048659 TaxID=3155489 RepID=UPI003425A2AB
MSAAVRCLLALTVLLTGFTGAAAATAEGRDGGAARTAAAEPMDTSWGDHYVRPQL